MASQLTEIVIESTDPQSSAEFWAAALGWELRSHQPGDVPWVSASGDTSQHDLKLVFVVARDPEHLANRLYVDAQGAGTEDELERLVQLGAEQLSEPSSALPLARLRAPGGVGLSMLADPID